MRELRPGLRHWTAPHPDWSPDEPWGQSVSSYALEDGERLLPFGPIAPPAEIEELAADRQTAIVLTNPWHERDAQSFLERHSVPIYALPTHGAPTDRAALERALTDEPTSRG